MRLNTPTTIPMMVVVRFWSASGLVLVLFSIAPGFVPLNISSASDDVGSGLVGTSVHRGINMM